MISVTLPALRAGIILFILFSVILPGHASDARVFSSEHASFSVKFKNEISPYNVIGVFLLPGETTFIEVIDTYTTGKYILNYSEGHVNRVNNRQWRFRAHTTPGLYTATIFNPERTDSVTLNIFVMVPRSEKKRGYINGYRIGNYPTSPLRGLSAYRTPKGFIEVTPENENTYLSPHLQLKQFLCKQAGDYPKYVVLHERLLLKLQLILEQVNERGYFADTFVIMSGYRTPYYNHSIGNAQYSRHVYGDAADIFIDTRPPYGMMDDLNGDGRIDHRDAAILYEIIDELYPHPWYKPFRGGLGLYKERPGVRGPFVHVDARGNRARWKR